MRPWLLITQEEGILGVGGTLRIGWKGDSAGRARKGWARGGAGNSRPNFTRYMWNCLLESSSTKRSAARKERPREAHADCSIQKARFLAGGRPPAETPSWKSGQFQLGRWEHPTSLPSLAVLLRLVSPAQRAAPGQRKHSISPPQAGPGLNRRPLPIRDAETAEPQCSSLKSRMSRDDENHEISDSDFGTNIHANRTSLQGQFSGGCSSGLEPPIPCGDGR
jgi:hypothetical protein